MREACACFVCSLLLCDLTGPLLLLLPSTSSLPAHSKPTSGRSTDCVRAGEKPLRENPSPHGHEARAALTEDARSHPRRSVTVLWSTPTRCLSTPTRSWSACRRLGLCGVCAWLTTSKTPKASRHTYSVHLQGAQTGASATRSAAAAVSLIRVTARHSPPTQRPSRRRLCGASSTAPRGQSQHHPHALRQSQEENRCGIALSVSSGCRRESFATSLHSIHAE